MTDIEIRAFGTDDLPAAGRLLAERHRQHRLAEPLLSPRYEDPTAAEAEVTAAWKTEGASGATALRNGELIGYLVGSPKGDLWGPNVWVEAAGQATSTPEVMRDLYSAAATTWVDQGRTEHYVMTPAHDDELVQAWFRLSFGQQQAHAVRELPTGPQPVPPKVTVRRPRRDDIPRLAELELVLPQHQALSPTYAASSIPTIEEVVADWEDDFDNPDFTTFVAEYDGRVIGSAVGCALEKSSTHSALTRPDNAGFLGFAAVFPEARGLGAGRALGEAVLAWAAEAGFACVATDWRVTNLLSSRAWPALGFRETFLRLHRTIGR